MERKHLNYVDSIKGLAMILVVWGHCGSKNYFYNTLYYIHLPIFIIISGCLLKYNNSWMKDDFSNILKKKTKQIMYPFFAFGVLSIIRY